MDQRVKDDRYQTVKLFWDAGRIKTFGDIFKKIPKTVVGLDLGMRSEQMTSFIRNPADFRLVKILHLARLLEVDYLPLMEMAVRQSLEYLEGDRQCNPEDIKLYLHRRGRRRKVQNTPG